MGKYLAILGITGSLIFALWLGITRYGAAQYNAGVQATAAQVNAANAQGAIKAAQQYAQGIKDSNDQSLKFLNWHQSTFTPAKETTIRETTKFMQSPAGAVKCFDADGLHAANADIQRANAFTASSSASGSGSTVPSAPTDILSTGRKR